MNPQQGKALLEFVSAADAAALLATGPHQLQGSMLELSRGPARPIPAASAAAIQAGATRHLCLAGLPASVDAQGLRAGFSQFGAIESLYVVDGTWYVNFCSVAAAVATKANFGLGTLGRDFAPTLLRASLDAIARALRASLDAIARAHVSYASAHEAQEAQATLATLEDNRAGCLAVTPAASSRAALAAFADAVAVSAHVQGGLTMGPRTIGVSVGEAAAPVAADEAAVTRAGAAEVEVPELLAELDDEETTEGGERAVEVEVQDDMSEDGVVVRTVGLEVLAVEVASTEEDPTTAQRTRTRGFPAVIQAPPETPLRSTSDGACASSSGGGGAGGRVGCRRSIRGASGDCSPGSGSSNAGGGCRRSSHGAGGDGPAPSRCSSSSAGASGVTGGLALSGSTAGGGSSSALAGGSSNPQPPNKRQRVANGLVVDCDLTEPEPHPQSDPPPRPGGGSEPDPPPQLARPLQPTPPQPQLPGPNGTQPTPPQQPTPPLLFNGSTRPALPPPQPTPPQPTPPQQSGLPLDSAPALAPLAVFRPPDAVVISFDGESASDDDCYEIPPPISATSVTLNVVNDLGDDDIEYVGASGGLLAQDLPHPRRFCTANPFTLCWAKKTVAGNEKACARCYCFVCDVEWAECTQWTSENTKQPAHCNAHGGQNSAMWVRMKTQWHQSAARAAAAAVTPIPVEL